MPQVFYGESSVAEGSKKLKLRLADNGDGTGSLAGGGGGGGDASAANQTTIIGHLDGVEGSLTTLTTRTPALGQTNSAGSSPVVIASDQSVLPVKGFSPTFTFTLSVATGALTAGDIVADTEALANLMRTTDSTGVLQSLVLIDEADQKAPLDIYFLSANVSMGTEDAAPSISDANAANILGVVSLATGDYKDLGGVSIASIKGIGMGLMPASGGRIVYVAIVTTGTPTYGSSTALKLRLSVLQD